MFDADLKAINPPRHTQNVAVEFVVFGKAGERVDFVP